MDYINFDTQKAEAFVSKYNEANNKGEQEFIYEGKTFLIGYSRYMIEYLVQKGLIQGEFLSGKSFWMTHLN